jgi:hypothetical protein
MNRFVWLLIAVLALAACARHEATRTYSPSPTLVASPTLIPLSTATPAGSPVPRITVVPSATRLPTTDTPEPTQSSASASSTPEPQATVTPSFTPTPRIIDAGPTPTVLPEPTPTLTESPVPTPTAAGSPLQPPSAPTDTPLSSPAPTDTPLSSPAPTAASGEVLVAENVYSYYDSERQTWFVAGEVINFTTSNQRITRIRPVVLDEDEMPLTGDENVYTLPGYDELREAVTLALDQSLPFNYEVSLPDGITVEDNYEIQIEWEPVGPAHEGFTLEFEDSGEWPDLFYIEGTFDNPGPDLTTFVAIVVTVFDEEARVIGVGWHFETDPRYLAAGEHGFDVDVIAWDIAAEVPLELSWYDVQVFGE